MARELRVNQTESEKQLWEILRNRKLFGKKFLRQHPIKYDFYKRPLFFIADFYCAEARLVIELDGEYHKYQQDYDEQRSLILNIKELRVLRIKNQELNDIDSVIKKIKQYL